MRFALFRRAPEPEPLDLTVLHGGERFRVALRRRPAARRLTLRVSSVTGEVVLTIPQRTALSTAQTFADAHGGWIAARLKRVPERVELAPGAVVPVRSVPHRIEHASTTPGVVRIGRDEAGHPVIAVSCDAPHVPRRVREYLEREARRDLAAAVARHTAALGIPARRITVRDTRSRWGSCSSKGCLNFSWRLILAPPSVLDYLAAHEVAHLKEMNHSERFWRETRRLCPGTDEAEAWLKRHGAELHRYG